MKYKAFTAPHSSRPSLLLFKSALLGIKTDPDRAFPYGCLTLLETCGVGFVITLIYSLPVPGPMVVRVTGKGLAPLVDAILDGTAREVQVFDPALFLPVPEGDWDTAGHQWKGKPVVEEILIWDKPLEEKTAH